MINRSYFYHFVLQDINPKFMNGIVTVRSFLPDANKAWSYAMSIACEKWECDKSKVRCETFNQV